MNNIYEEISPKLRDFIANQRMFFVATAPLSAEGHVNLSPKGHDTLRVLDPHRVAYLDLSGSGVETIAHLRENGRICIMFCAFDGPPKIIRLHGRGRVLTPEQQPEFGELLSLFPDLPGGRAIIVVDVVRIAGSCGFSVPRFEFVEQRDQLVKWVNKKGPDWLDDYRKKNNAVSIDELPAIDPDPESGD
ncbi:pyridoxamine 5'-phosphate oxidase family protein [Corallococcus exercitus]|uniref:pyridoxamine 5'-phosphate oxidase family protein n=1 Tax=Corallococcus exercitus TaxID=2316736 RepID=UPI000EA2F576|nr:pyridoxamine 5'-phosphate oxidase family protein [Corallococcus exercitus]RKG79670.1 pyridoxamine 5'-phosphate oxidase family protein [Corallococcus exercitus]